MSGHEKKEGRLRSRSTTLIGDLSEFFANFCINSFPRTFADTQQSLTSQSRFASNTSSSSISHTRETAFFLNIRGQVDRYLYFCFGFLSFDSNSNKNRRNNTKKGGCKTQTLQELPKIDSKIRVKWVKNQCKMDENQGKWIKIRVRSYYKVFESAF